MSLPPFSVQAKWSGRTQTFELPADADVAHLTKACMETFGLETCKIVGLVKGKLPDPTTPISQLHAPGSTLKLLLIGVAGGSLSALGKKESAYEVRRLEEEAREAERRRLVGEREAREAEERERRRVQEEIWERERAERQRHQRLEWEERRRAEDAARLEREMRSEQDSANVCRLDLHAFHRPELDGSDDLLLPPDALQQLIQAKVAFQPITFQLCKSEDVDAVAEQTRKATQDIQRNHAQEQSNGPTATSAAATAAAVSSMSESSTSSSMPASAVADIPLPIISPLCWYASVKDFTAPPQTVCVPASVMHALNLHDGAQLRLTTMQLPKAEHITLQPLTAAWSRLAEAQRRALLEFQLRKHRFIAQGSILTFTYHPPWPTFQFKVIHVQPLPVVSITDTELPTEILPIDDKNMLDAAPSTDVNIASTLTPSPMPSTSPSASSSSSSSASPLRTPTNLSADESVSGRLRMDGSVTFGYEINDPNVEVSISVSSTKGDVDLYILQADSTDSQVSICNYTWCAQSRGNVEIKLSAAGPLFRLGAYQIMLHAYGEDGEYKLLVKERQVDSSANRGQQLGSTSSSVNTSIAPPDSTRCPNCHSFIPSKSMPLHSVQCARINSICSACGIVVKNTESDKHRRLVHAVYTCQCGAELEQEPMVRHKRESCPLRLVSCSYCPLKLIVAERGSHQAECGMLTSHCSICSEPITRKTIRRHLVREHGGVNGKTDEREIVAEDFWH